MWKLEHKLIQDQGSRVEAEIEGLPVGSVEVSEGRAFSPLRRQGHRRCPEQAFQNQVCGIARSSYPLICVPRRLEPSGGASPSIRVPEVDGLGGGGGGPSVGGGLGPGTGLESTPRVELLELGQERVVVEHEFLISNNSQKVVNREPLGAGYYEVRVHKALSPEYKMLEKTLA